MGYTGRNTGAGRRGARRLRRSCTGGKPTSDRQARGAGRADLSQGTKHEAAQKPLDEIKGAMGQDYPGTCRAMQDCAGLCTSRRENARQCNTIQGYAGRCSTKQDYAGRCRTMQDNAGLCGTMGDDQEVVVVVVLRVSVVAVGVVAVLRGDVKDTLNGHHCMASRACLAETTGSRSSI
jgi:hypothetical protein